LNKAGVSIIGTYISVSVKCPEHTYEELVGVKFSRLMRHTHALSNLASFGYRKKDKSGFFEEDE